MANKILFVIGALDVGGAERHILQVASGLPRAEFTPMVFTLTCKGRLAPLLEANGVRVIAPPGSEVLRAFPALLRGLFLLPLSFLALLFVLWKVRPQVIHFFLPAAYLLGGLCSLMAPVPLRGMSRRSLNVYQKKHPVRSRLEILLHRKMDFILGNSNAVVTQLQGEGIPAARLGLIYNGIDISAFQHLPARREVRNHLGVDESALVLTMVANLIPYKGHADLLAALGRVMAAMPDGWVLVCVGRDTGYGKHLRQLAAAYGLTDRIKWLGERTDVHAIYSASDIGILCSHQEGFSNSVLEGMAAGLPMVVTNVGGNAEAVIDQECGLVVPAHDPDALGKAIVSLAGDADMRQRMASAGQLRVAEKFSLDSCVVQYAGLYRSLLREPNCLVQEAIDAASDGDEI